MRNTDLECRCKPRGKEVNPMAENVLKIRDDECVVLNSSGDGFEIRRQSFSWLASGIFPNE